MKFKLDDLEVFFPYKFVYREQYEYMKSLKKTLDLRGHAILEMPTGTGKTISLLSLITSYLIAYPESFTKLIYCTRTVPEMDKTLRELKVLMESRKKELNDDKKLLAVGLSARKNLCIHPKVVEHSNNREKTDSECRKRTAPWVRIENKGKLNENQVLCNYYEGFQDQEADLKLDDGVFTLDDLKEYGKKQNVCPYFFARKVIGDAKIVVYSYMYFLDPMVGDLISKELKGDCIVVFDEAHNIDDICCEAYHIELNRPLLDGALRNINELKDKIEEIKQVDKNRLEEEYSKLVKGMAAKGLINEESKLEEAAPDIINGLVQETIPGNIRKADHFIMFLKKFVIFVRGLINIKDVKILSPDGFLEELNKSTHLEATPLKFFNERLRMLLNTLEYSDHYSMMPLLTLTLFGTFTATYTKGFSLIIEPFSEHAPDLNDPFLNFTCLDSSLAMKSVFTRFKAVILTSGTMSPMEMYPKILDFKPMVAQSLDITLRNCINPLIISKGADQVEVSSQFSLRNEAGVLRNYGTLLTDLCSVVPDGIVCFFPSYRYMEEVVNHWNDTGVLDEIIKHKLLFIESKDVKETSLSLASYRKACEIGRGGVFFSIARGKVAEGIDFDEHYGRAVIMFGVPFQYTRSRMLLARLDYLRENFGIKESDFLIFDAMRQCAQCLGRVIRKKNDYGLMILADKRFIHQDKREKLPKWIRNYIEPHNINISTDQAIYKARLFFKEMGADYKIDTQAFYTKDDIEELEQNKETQKVIEGEGPISMQFSQPMSFTKPSTQI